MHCQFRALVGVALIFCFAPAVRAQERAAQAKPLQVVIAHGPGKGDLRRFAEFLEKNFKAKVTWITAEKSRKEKATPFTGIENLKHADVIVSNLYRTWAPPKQLAKLKRAFTTKPIVGLRKAHHGFQNWLKADEEVFGVDYRGHYGNAKNGWIEIVKDKKNDPLLKGLKVTMPGGGCYSHRDPQSDLRFLMIGGQKGKPAHPQTWTRIVKKRANQRVFYTRYDPRDMTKNPTVRDMVIRAIFWTAEQRVAKGR